MARKSVRRGRHKSSVKKKQSKDTSSLSQNDFIIYLTSALVLKGVQWINKDNSREFIASLRAAQDTINHYAIYERLRFDIRADPIHGNSGTVDDMIYYLCQNWARRGENRHVIYIDGLPLSIAENYLNSPKANSKAVWLLAADSFIRYASRARCVGLQQNSSYI